MTIFALALSTCSNSCYPKVGRSHEAAYWDGLRFLARLVGYGLDNRVIRSPLLFIICIEYTLATLLTLLGLVGLIALFS